jgi:hypothetical protein
MKMYSINLISTLVPKRKIKKTAATDICIQNLPFVSVIFMVIRVIQQLLGHKSVETTMIYTHVLRDMQGVPQSPLDMLMKDGPEGPLL